MHEKSLWDRDLHQNSKHKAKEVSNFAIKVVVALENLTKRVVVVDAKVVVNGNTKAPRVLVEGGEGMGSGDLGDIGCLLGI